MKKLLLVIAILSCGCYTRAAMRQADADMLSHSITYYRDTRTGACFSGAYLRVDGALWSSVECTPEIEATAVEFTSEP